MLGTDYIIAPKIPRGLAPAVEGLAREILRQRPRDIYTFASRHFEKLIELRDKERVSGALPENVNRKHFHKYSRISACTGPNDAEIYEDCGSRVGTGKYGVAVRDGTVIKKERMTSMIIKKLPKKKKDATGATSGWSIHETCKVLRKHKRMNDADKGKLSNIEVNEKLIEKKISSYSQEYSPFSGDSVHGYLVRSSSVGSILVDKNNLKYRSKEDQERTYRSSVDNKRDATNSDRDSTKKYKYTNILNRQKSVDQVESFWSQLRETEQSKCIIGRRRSRSLVNDSGLTRNVGLSSNDELGLRLQHVNGDRIFRNYQFGSVAEDQEKEEKKSVQKLHSCIEEAVAKSNQRAEKEDGSESEKSCDSVQGGASSSRSINRDTSVVLPSVVPRQSSGKCSRNSAQNLSREQDDSDNLTLPPIASEVSKSSRKEDDLTLPSVLGSKDARVDLDWYREEPSPEFEEISVLEGATVDDKMEETDKKSEDLQASNGEKSNDIDVQEQPSLEGATVDDKMEETEKKSEDLQASNGGKSNDIDVQERPVLEGATVDDKMEDTEKDEDLQASNGGKSNDIDVQERPVLEGATVDDKMEETEKVEDLQATNGGKNNDIQEQPVLEDLSTNNEPGVFEETNIIPNADSQETDFEESFKDSLNVTPDSMGVPQRPDSLEPDPEDRNEENVECRIVDDEKEEKEALVLEMEDVSPSNELKRKLLEIEMVERKIENTLVSSQTVPACDEFEKSRSISAPMIGLVSENVDLAQGNEGIVINEGKGMGHAGDESRILDPNEGDNSSNMNDQNSNESIEINSVKNGSANKPSPNNSEISSGRDTSNPGPSNSEETPEEAWKKVDASCRILTEGSPYEIPETVTTVVVLDEEDHQRGSLEAAEESKQSLEQDGQDSDGFGEYVQPEVFDGPALADAQLLSDIKNAAELKNHAGVRKDLENIKEEEENECGRLPSEIAERNSASKSLIGELQLLEDENGNGRLSNEVAECNSVSKSLIGELQPLEDENENGRLSSEIAECNSASKSFIGELQLLEDENEIGRLSSEVAEGNSVSKSLIGELQPLEDENEIGRLSSEVAEGNSVSKSLIGELQPLEDENENGRLSNEVAEGNSASKSLIGELRPLEDENENGRLSSEVADGNAASKSLIGELQPLEDEKEIGRLSSEVADSNSASKSLIGELQPLEDEKEIGRLSNEVAEGNSASKSLIEELQPLEDENRIDSESKLMGSNGEEQIEGIEKQIVGIEEHNVGIEEHIVGVEEQTSSSTRTELDKLEKKEHTDDTIAKEAELPEAEGRKISNNHSSDFSLSFADTTPHVPELNLDSLQDTTISSFERSDSKAIERQSETGNGNISPCNEENERSSSVDTLPSGRNMATFSSEDESSAGKFSGSSKGLKNGIECKSELSDGDKPVDKNERSPSSIEEEIAKELIENLIRDTPMIQELTLDIEESAHPERTDNAEQTYKKEEQERNEDPEEEDKEREKEKLIEGEETEENRNGREKCVEPNEHQISEDIAIADGEKSLRTSNLRHTGEFHDSLPLSIVELPKSIPALNVSTAKSAGQTRDSCLLLRTNFMGNQGSAIVSNVTVSKTEPFKAIVSHAIDLSKNLSSLDREAGWAEWWLNVPHSVGDIDQTFNDVDVKNESRSNLDHDIEDTREPLALDNSPKRVIIEEIVDDDEDKKEEKVLV